MRLIDVDKLKKRFCGHCVDYENCEYKQKNQQCFDLELMDSIPTYENKTITWEEYQKDILALKSRVKTDIICPKCGSLIYKNTDIVLTCYPAKYYYECDNCGWHDLGY